MPPIAHATFSRRGEHIFRTEATIQWGESKKPLGLLIMLNPGSCQLSDDSIWRSFIKDKNNTISGQVDLDKTMKAAVSILEATHPSLNGVLTIHNVFNLRDQESANALSIYDEFFITKDRTLLYSSFDRCVKREYRDILHARLTKEYIDEFPWVWLAWTVNKRLSLNARRRQILDQIPLDKNRFAIYSTQAEHQSERELYTKHISPRNPKDCANYSAEMIQIMVNYWRQK